MTFYSHTYLDTGNNGPGLELCTVLPVLRTYTAPRAVFEIDLGCGPVPGEILQFNARLETTNDLGYNVSVIDAPYLSDIPAGPGGVLVNNDKGYEVAEDLGENATPGIHHSVAAVSRSWRCRESDGDLTAHRYLRYVLTAASSAAPTSGLATMAVMQDYGQLDVIRWTPCDLEAMIAEAVALAAR